jgi:hypothetical protein
MFAKLLQQRRFWALTALLLGLAAPAHAHDTWVMPANFRVPAGQPISTLLSAGNGLTPLSAPQRRNLRVLQLVHSAGRQEPERWQRSGKSAQAHFPAFAPGVGCLALSTNDNQIEIEPDTVDEYLREVQAPVPVLEAWKRQRVKGEAWVERYAKDAKTYLRSGTASTGWPALAQLGHRLEMVPQSDPTRLEAGDTLTVMLQFDGKPVPDIALRLFAGTAAERVVRTDAQGKAQFKLSASGPHLIATTVIQLPAAPGAPWTSRFATLGFGVGAS